MSRALRLATVGTLAIVTAMAAPPVPQVQNGTVSPLRAVGDDAAGRQPHPPDAAVSYYANILPAQPGEMGLDHVDALPGYQFTAIRIVSSVAPSVFADTGDMSSRHTADALGSLRHLSSHLTVKPLDKSGQVIDRSPAGPVVLTILEISPSEPSFADKTGNAQSAVSTAVNQASSLFKPASSAVQAFQAAYHRHPSTTQIAYMTAANAFGWRWYESPGATIEGLHNGAALFQIADGVTALRITVDLVADWRAFGVWSRTFEFVFTLPRPPG